MFRAVNMYLPYCILNKRSHVPVGKPTTQATLTPLPFNAITLLVTNCGRTQTV